jgi:hypothetical protein
VDFIFAEGFTRRGNPHHGLEIATVALLLRSDSNWGVIFYILLVHPFQRAKKVEQIG